MTSTSVSEDLANALKTYSALATRVKELSSASQVATNEEHRISILRQLALAISAFDD